MIALGLLWFDDDPRVPVARKIADALERYHERVGLEPTICQLNPAQAAALLAPVVPRPRARSASGAPAAPATLPSRLRLEPSEALSANYFLIGYAAGEQPKAVRGWRPQAEEDRHARPASHPRARRAAATPTAPTAKARAPARSTARSA